jgi:PAS domain S-box-containing protein
MLQGLRAQGPRSDQASSAWRWTTSIWVAAVIGSVYALAAKLSLSLLTPDGVAVFWPAAGVAAGALIALGPRARWPVVIGAMAATIVANLMGDRNVPSAIVFALCNGGEALLTAVLVERYFEQPFDLDRLRQVLGLLGAAIVATTVSGIGGAIGFAVFHGANASFFIAWQNWFASDALGIVTVAPLLIGLASVARDLPARNEVLEGLVALVLLVIMSIVIIMLPRQPWLTAVPIGLLFPVLLWIAARCRPVFAAAAAFIVTVAIVWTTSVGVGRFGDPSIPMDHRVLAARAGILAVALCAYVLAALFAERRRQAAELAESEARLQEALTAGAVATFVWDVGLGASQRSANAAQILGFDPRQVFSSAHFLSRVRPDDRGQFKALVRGVKPEHPGYSTTFRFQRPDGREVWLEETAKGEFDAAGRLVRLKGLTLDVTARKRFEDQQSLLIDALDRRVESLLARVALVADGTRRGSGSLDEYVQALERRLRSMADAYALLSRNRWGGVDLAELVRLQIAPHATEASATIGGPDVTVTVAVTQALAMVLHELVTNAARHGALSTPHGRVEVSWNRVAGENGEILSISWREIRGPAVVASPDGRYGVGVIRDLVAQELGGSVELAFAPDGFTCKIEIPLEAAPDGNSRRGAFRTPGSAPGDSP